MATLQEYYNRYDRIRSRLSIINGQITFLVDEVRRGALLGPPDNIDSRADALNDQINSAIDALNDLSEEVASSNLTPSQQVTMQRVIGETGEGYLDAQQRLNGVIRGAADNQREKKLREQTQPKNSAGDIVDTEKDAKAEDANTQSPEQQDLTLDDRGRVVSQPENNNTATNARKSNTQDDTEINADQAPVGGDAVSTVGGDTPVVKSQQTQGADTAPPDDFTPPPRTTTATSAGDGKPAIAKEFLEPIVSRPNLLSGISNLNYSLSLYMLSPEELSEFVNREQKILPSRQLLMQSGGINNQERNEWFNVDFYIEDFTLESVIGTQSVGSPHNAVSLEFTVVEPQGITFLNRLNNAVIDHMSSQQPQDPKEKINAMAQNYMMVIRFYGYDGSGNLITSSDLGLGTTTDSNAIIEKFIPFNITTFTYKINTKATEYRIGGVCQGTNIAFSTQRGEIPFNVQLSAGSIDQLFNGTTVIADTQANEETPGQTQTQSGTTQTVAQGLIQALNEQQQKLAGTSYDIPDQYEVIFQDTDIKNAKLLKPGNVNKGRATNNNSNQAAQKYLQSKLNFDKETQSYNVLAGTQITQLLDLVLRTSSYVTSQQNVYIDEKTGKPVGKSSDVKTVQWYRIKSQVDPIGYDKKRRSMAYKITYIVNKYQINTPRSPHFPPAEYRGVHKLYNYWFTGQNTEVLDFEIDVNANYYTVIGNDGLIDESPQGQLQSGQSYSSGSGQSLQGGERGSTMPAANLSDRLYSVGDVASGEITIVGDPDWIQQSELVYNKSLGLTPFAPDGSVNYDSSEVLFELRFNPVQDYDLETGLSNVYENNRTITLQSRNEDIVQANVAQESLVWSATTVTSMFKEGQFTQRVYGVYRDFAASKNAPINPQSQTVLNDGNTVEKSLANRERDDQEPTGAIVGGVRTNAGGTANRDRAQNQRKNLNSGEPKTSVTTVTSQASQGDVVGGRSAAARRPQVTASPNQSVDDDAGTETTRRIGGRSARARRR